MYFVKYYICTNQSHKFMSKKKYEYGKPYKLKALQLHSSSEWMANSRKKYRKVFDKSEITYLRAEFSFYNKLFDEEEWKADVRIKVYDITKDKREEIFNLSQNHTIGIDKNTVYVYESWGVDTAGGFWKAGDYVCEAYIDEELVGTQNFWIYDVGNVTQNNNPYFDLLSIKLYEGPYDGWNIEKPVYLTQFDRKQTRYVWAEIKIKSKTNKKWSFEYFVNFFDDAGQHKAQIESLEVISNGSKDKEFVYKRGWGNATPGSWMDDKYFCELVFMDTLAGSTWFTTGDTQIEGEIPVIKERQISAIIQSVKEAGAVEEKVEDVMERLNELIGLENIKQKVADHINYLDFLKIRKEKGFEDKEEITLHSVFTGNPGTGKTTVVKLLGKIYQQKGLLSKGHVHEVDRADLVGEFIGQTAPKVREAIKEARGGILFVDEAYMLVRSADDKKDFGKEVIEVLVKEMSDGPGDIAIMMAGYPKETMFMINSNPGLKSRIKYFFNFEDYTPDELIQISKYAVNKRFVSLDKQAEELINKILTEAYRNRDSTFGNARFVYSIIDEAKMNMGLRLMQQKDIKKLSNELLSTITPDDVEKIEGLKIKKKINIPIDENLLKESIHELNSLVGLNTIKNEINELIKLVRYYKETGKDVLNKFSLHAVFTGNPGTGKTTVARIFGKIYKALGLLERGHMVETGKEGLVAGYIGQTALKAKEKIDQAIGGVLFIDEAYALAGGGPQSYGNEAIEVILKNMEDLRGKFAVIVAGYPDNMESFLRMNPGLKSRFDKTMHFNDYSPEILYNITSFMLKQEELTPDTQAAEHLKAYITELFKRRDKFFGNARTMRKIAEEAVKKQNLRMASVTNEERTGDAIYTLTLADVKDIQIDEIVKQSSSIGFS